jgi:hypothetical protein
VRTQSRGLHRCILGLCAQSVLNCVRGVRAEQSLARHLLQDRCNGFGLFASSRQRHPWQLIRRQSTWPGAGRPCTFHGRGRASFAITSHCGIDTPWHWASTRLALLDVLPGLTEGSLSRCCVCGRSSRMSKFTSIELLSPKIGGGMGLQVFCLPTSSSGRSS